MNRFVMTGTILMCAMSVQAKVVTKTVEYKVGDTRMISFLAYDDAGTGKRPGVLVVPEWWGLTDLTKHRAEMLAELGYVALAVDMYGEGKTTTDPKVAGTLAGKVKGDVTMWRKLIHAGYDQLAHNGDVDTKRVACIGYCFGGSTSLQLAYSEPNLAGIVSFHGGLMPAKPEDLKNIKAKILICHGAADSFVPQADIDATLKALNDAHADWQMISYAGAVHGFTNPNAAKAGLKDVAYNEKADKRSWQHMKDFFAEIFK